LLLSLQGRAFATQSSDGKEEVSGSAAESSLEERVKALEAEAVALKKKLAEVEKLAKRKGFIAAMMDYGAPFALWYAFCWLSSLFSIYLLLEWEVVSWQDSLRPFFEGLGLESYTERIDASTGNLVIAFMVNELIEAVRFPLVLATGAPIIKLANRWKSQQAATASATAAAGAASAAGAAADSKTT